MKTTLLFTTLAVLFPQIVLADFSGGDSMASKSSKWDLFSTNGGGKAVFHITSNDPDESPFDIKLTGQGVNWREMK